MADALHHLYVLLPVLDDAKHYWVSTDEVDKLIRAGDGWLADHPEKALITRRYLRHRDSLTRAALARLAEVDDLEPEQLDDADAGPRATDPGVANSDDGDKVTLAEQRRGAVLAAVRASGAQRVGDFGCGEGTLLPALLGERTITHVLAADVSARSLEIAARRIGLDRMSDTQRNPDQPAADLAGLHRRTADRSGRRRADGGDRARRRVPAARARTVCLRGGETGDRDHHDPERGVQRALRDAAGRRAPAP